MATGSRYTLIIATHRGNEMINRPDEVTAKWIGQDGGEWRDLKVWVGNGYRSFTQRHIGNGIWI